MPINVIGDCNSINSDNKVDTSLFVQKSFLRTNYIESKIEENIDLKNELKIKHSPEPVSIGQPVSKKYVDNKFNEPSIITNSSHVDFKDKNLDNVRFVEINSMPAVREHLLPNFYVDQYFSYWLDELSLSKLDLDEQIKLDEQDSIIPNSALTSTKAIIEIPTKSYVDSLHESSRNRRDLLSVFNDQDNEFDDNK